jgi:hypothetical protein
MDIPATANTIYALIKDDAAACASIRAEAASLALALPTDPNAAATITSATINGQSFASKDSMSQIDRLKLLNWIVKCLNNGGAISRMQRFHF